MNILTEEQACTLYIRYFKSGVYSIWWCNFLKLIEGQLNDKIWWGLQSSVINKELKKHGGQFNLCSIYTDEYENVPACIIFDTSDDAIVFKLKFV